MPRCSFVIPGDWLTPTGGYRYDRRIVLALRDAGIRVLHVALPDGYPMPSPTALEASRKIVEDLPDGEVVVVDGLAFGVLPELMAAQAARLKLVALVHHPLHLETGLDPAMAQALRRSEAQALTAARRVIVTSSSTVDDVRALGVAAHRIDIVEPGVDKPPVASRQRRAPGAALRLLCVATLVPRKGHAVLFEALAGLRDRPWTLNLVGSAARDPANSSALAAQAAGLGIGERIRWHGELDEAGVASLYDASDLFVLPSFYEGYGMVVIEALSHGLPVVTTTGGALARTLPAGAGWHVPPGDAPALRDALRRAMDEEALLATMAEGARRAAGALPTWPQSAARFGEVLAGLEANA